MTLLIVIVNYRTADFVLDCLQSLRDEVTTVASTRVVVTDNASGGDEVTRLEAAVRGNGWGDWATIQPLERNGGFAFGNNMAIRPALTGADPPRYILLLNPDTIVRPGALRTLVDFLEGRPEVGIAGCRLEDRDGAAQLSTFRFPSLLGELEGGMRFGPMSRLLSRCSVTIPLPSEACPVDWVSGACVLIRREVFASIDLLDEGYFLYFEEVDFCRRARCAGWQCWYVPMARVVHLVGQSSGMPDPLATKKRCPGHWFLSRRRYFRDHHGLVRMVLADLIWMMAFVSYRLRRFVQQKPANAPQWLLWDFVRYNFLLARK